MGPKMRVSQYYLQHNAVLTIIYYNYTYLNYYDINTSAIHIFGIYNAKYFIHVTQCDQSQTTSTLTSSSITGLVRFVIIFQRTGFAGIKEISNRYENVA